MIEFKCPDCERAFAVPDSFAGRRARCKNCQTELTVPQAYVPTESVPDISAPPTKMPLRLKRLIAESQQVMRTFANFDLIRVRPAEGNPPDKYLIEYRIGGLDRGPKNQPIPRDQHVVEIQLTHDYPRLAPKCRMLTDVFHPNIDPTTICVGDHWTAGERLVDLIVRIGEMLSYQAYNIKSPLDGEAAMWADLNRDKLPVDNRNLRPPGME
jgi:ubiquitin-protein ligase